MNSFASSFPKGEPNTGYAQYFIGDSYLAPTPLTPGTVIDIPEGVKHWHGAQKDSWFQHYTTHVATGGEQSNEWLEAVTDEVYNKLQ